MGSGGVAPFLPHETYRVPFPPFQLTMGGGDCSEFRVPVMQISSDGNPLATISYVGGNYNWQQVR